MEGVKLSAGLHIGVTVRNFFVKFYTNWGAERMKQRFTGSELFNVRNLIPVDWLIKEKLHIPSKQTGGYFRFLCPVCEEFQTATNPKTNLARCFRCETNYNSIDLVMAVKGFGFVESVKYLKGFLPETPGPVIRDMSQVLEHIGTRIGR
jgi:hypothetical protein